MLLSLASYSIVLLYGLIRVNRMSANFSVYRTSLHGIILGFRKFDHISQGIKSLKWLPVKDRFSLNDAIMMYKCINKLAPDYLADKFVQRSHIHNRNTRSRNQLDIPRCRISTGQRSFVYRGTQLWNSLSYDVRTTKMSQVFKRRLINILLSS